jgi:hypothetical protein
MERNSEIKAPIAFVWIASLVCSAGLIILTAPRCCGGNAELSIPSVPPNVQQLLDQNGKWQGVIQEAKLEGNYEDTRQQAIPFGCISFYLAPWRAYMDTWPAEQYLTCPGINFNVPFLDAKATARVLADAGFRSARVEVGWGNLGYDDPRKVANADRYKETFQALRNAGIRPLVVLNANARAPVPYKYIAVNVRQPASAGAREIVFDRTDLIRPGYTGFINQRMGFPLVTATDSQTGRCELSAPLWHDVPAGKLMMVDLKYHPFSGTVFADGTPNPFAEETVKGWAAYVATICQMLKEDLGTEGKPDAGFDLEVWNEYTFGSDFLDEKSYYETPRKFKTDISYQNHGRTSLGHELILPVTVDYANDPASRVPGVHVISGFANQRPFENGASMWPGQTGFSRHFYTNLDPYGPFRGTWGFLSPTTNNRPNIGPLNALGLVDGKPNGKNLYSVIPGTFFVPTVAMSMPEGLHYGTVPEFMTRDLQPFPALWQDHYRFSNPGDGHPAEVWMTETNTGRSTWLKHLMNDRKVKPDDPRIIALSHQVGAKALLRTLVFQSHKGVHTIEIFAAHGGDLNLGVIPDSFFKALQEEDHQLTAKVRAQAGPQLEVLARVNQLMKSGQPMAVTRPLAVTELIEHQPRLVFKGDGTPEHPDRFNRDDFACLPFQMAADKYAIGYYVVTRNMVNDWNPKLDPLDPARYDMPEQTFDLTLRNLRGVNAKVTAWDPMTNQTVPATVLASDEDSLKVQLQTVDYPRFLLIQEAQPGPLILEPELQREADGEARVSFRTNLPVSATLTWGPWPERNADGHVNLPKGTSFDYHIPRLQKHEAVQVTIEQDGLTAPWPRWKHDTAGVLW